MTEFKESKEDTIHKLSSLSWRRKLNERNSFPKCVNSESDQFWKAVAKPNSDLRYNDEIIKQTRQNQTHAFKTKNELIPASKQSRDDYHYVKLEGNENDNEKTLVALKVTSNDQKRERQLKTWNSYNGQNYRKDEKENVNHHKNIHRANPTNHIYTQNQKNFKRGDKNQNFRNMKNESLIPNSNENENSVKKDQRNSAHQQSWSNNQTNRMYHRNQEKSNNQSNYLRSEAQNRNSYQNATRNQNFRQNDFDAERSQHTGDPFNRNISPSENSFSHVSSNYSESETGITHENQTSAIHYQRTFSPKIKNSNYNANVTCNQATKSVFDENFIPQTELPQLGSLFGNATSNVNNIYSKENDDINSPFTNFSNANNFSNHFTAGISEPIPTNFYQNDKFQTNIPMETVNYVDNYTSSNQSLMSNNFKEPSSYSNQMFANTVANNNQRQFVDEFALSDKIPVTLSSLSPDVADFIPRKHRIQSANRVAYSNPVENLQQESELETRNTFSFSTPNNSQSQNTSWLSQNNSFISDCGESMISEIEGFPPYVDMPRTFNQNNSGERLNNISNLQPTAVRSVPNNTNNGQTFNFNGRMINLSGESNPSSVQTFNFNGRVVDLSGENTQNNANERSTNNVVQNFYPYEDGSVGNHFDHDLNNYAGISDYPENLGFNNQQISNILQIANLNLNQETAPISTPCNQRINDLRQMSNSNLNENIVRQTNASILSQTIVNNSSHQSVCGVMQNSRANTIREYYRKPNADAANHLKCDESEEMNSKLEMVAQQLFNINKYVTGAEMSGGTMTLKDSVSHSSSEQFNIASFNRYKNELEKYRNSRHFLNDGGRGSLSSSGNSENRYENLYTPTSSATCKSYDSFSPQTFSNSNFIRNDDLLFDIGSKYDEKPNTSIQSFQTLLKSECTHNHNHDRKMFNNQVCMTNNKPDNYTYINVRDDCSINFNRKNRQAGSSQPKFNATVGKPPSMGILKKPPKPVLDTSIQFQKSSKNQNTGDLFPSSKEISPLNKRVSFLLERD